MDKPMETDVQEAPAAIEENLNFFSIPAQDVGVLQRQWISVGPTNVISGDSPIEFNLDGNSASYVDLKATTLCIKCKVVKEDGSDIELKEEVAPVNMLLASMWKQVDIQLNHVNLKNCNMYYPYKAMFESLLFTNKDYKKGQLAAQLFRKDSAGFMDASKAGEGNDGFVWRQDKTTKSRPIYMEGRLFLDMVNQDRLVLNGVHLGVKLYHTSNAFKFMAGTENPAYKLSISEAQLKVCLVTVNPAIMIAQREVIERAPAIYPFNRTEMRAYSIATSEMNLNVENLFQGQVPHFLCVGLVSTDAFNGNYTKNPFHFAHFNLNCARFSVDGQSLPDEHPFEPDFDQKTFTHPYLALNVNKKGDTTWYNGISLDDFDGGYALYCFDIRSERELKRRGLTRLQLSFKKPLPQPVTAIVFAQFPDMLQIDQTNKVIQT